MSVNLESFYSVQLTSGTDVPLYIFPTYEDASNFAEKHDQEMREKFERWMNGDRSINSAIVQSQLVQDGNGGCYNQYFLSPAFLSSGVKYHKPFTADADCWKDEPGAESIKWGNPATARPSKRLI